MKKILSLTALFLTAVVIVAVSASAQTLSLNDGSITQSKTKHIGMNIGSINYWDSGQLLKNLVGSINPGFEPLTSKQIWALTAGGTATSFSNTDIYDYAPQNYWAGATFQIVTSQTNNGQQGCTGTITGNTGQVTIASITRSGGVVTVTTSAASGFAVGNPIVISGVANNSFNAYPAGTIQSVSGNTITYSQSGANATSAGGSAGQIAPVVYSTTACGGPFSVGDIVIMSQTVSPTPESWWEGATGGFWSYVSGGGKLTTDTTDLCPTCGTQAIDMNASASGSLARLAWYFDGNSDIFVLMNGTYQISFWAKTAAGTPTLNISANRQTAGGFSCGAYTQATSSAWTQYTYTCTASESQAATGVAAGQLQIQASGGAVYLDNVSFEKVGSTQPSVFRDEVITTLQNFKPGTFRYWLNQNGESSDNWTRPDYERGPSTAGVQYYVEPSGSGTVQLSLEDYLVATQTIGSEPYLEFPITFTAQDAANLIEFLAGPSSSTYGARRVALGQQEPWTSVFSKIHLSFGNESWNGEGFPGQNLPFRSNAPNDPNPICEGPCVNAYHDYSVRAQAIFAAMRSAPDYTAAPFDLVMNLFTGGNYLADDAIKVAQPDSVEIEDYTDFAVNSFATDQALWQPAFFEVYDRVTDPHDPFGFYASMHDYPTQATCGASGTSVCNVNIYEWADSTNSGSIDQKHLDYANAGAGQGIVAALEPLLNLQYFGLQNQNYFSLTETAGSGPNGEQTKLWGSVVDMGGATNNLRPQFLAMQLVNQSMIGSMYACSISNNSLFNFAGSSSNGSNLPTALPALTNVPYVYSFCFENGANRSIVLINTDLSNTHKLNFAGSNLPQGTVTQRQFAPSSPDDLNEAPTGTATNHTAATVALETSSLSSPSSITLPINSVTALDWVVSGSPAAVAPTFNTTPGTYPVAQTVAIADATTGATIYYTTNGSTPTTSSAVYSGPITVSSSETLSAIAAGTGFSSSPVATAAYTINPNIPAPTFSPAGGTFSASQLVTISETSLGANIYYTTNGTTPTAASTLYTGPITVSASETLEATAIANGDSNSVSSATFTITKSLPTPTFSVAGGTYSASQSVTIADATAGTTIYYTTSGVAPTTSSTKYTGAITVAASETLEAMAVETGYTNSSVATAAYTISSAAPASSTYINYASNGFTSTSLSMNGATVASGLLKLTDGGTEESRSTWYSTKVPVQTFTTDFTFQQLNATADGLTFTIQGQGAKALGGNGGGLGFQGITKSVAVKFDLHNNSGEGNDSTGLYTNGAAPTMPSVSLTSTAINLHSADLMHAHLVYDGTNLTMTLTDTVTSGSVTEVFPVNIPSIVGGTTAYVGFTGGTGNASATQEVTSWTYTVAPEQTAAAPKFSEASGTYTSAQTLTLTDATKGATIYYTSNGSTPTTSSAKYVGPITISATESLKAIAVETGYKSSAVVTEAFDISKAETSYLAYASGKVTSTNLALNKGAAVKSGVLELTDGGADESRSAWFKTLVPVQNFVADFTFQQLNAEADGMTFTIQKQGTTAVGSDAGGLGYQGIADSVAIKFDLVNTANVSSNSTGIYTKGSAPTLPEIAMNTAQINLHSGHVMHAHMQYDGANLIMTLTDTTTNTTVTEAFAVNIPSIVGADTAYVGFTGGTGSTSATQNVLSWSFLSSAQ